MTEQSESTRRALLKAAAGAGAAGTAASAGCLSITTPADIARETEPRGNIAYFVGASWLAEHRDDYRVLDARPTGLFRRARIYGARRIPLSGITQQQPTDAGRVPDVSAIAATFAQRGIRKTDDIVVYGDSVGSRVTRTVFALHAIGHEGDVRILNGGFGAWNGRVGTGTRGQATQRSFDPTPNEQLWVTREWIADRIGDEDAQGLIDVRVPEAFLAATGSNALDPGHERHGHIPGSTNVHWLGNIADGRIRDPGDLFDLYANQAGLDDSRTVIVYGDDNVDATQTWVTLRAIGFDDVRVFDGGFAEWANVDGDHGRYPVETGTDAVIDVEGEGEQTDGGDFTCS